MKQDTSIILFDGVCNLCNGTVHFLLKRDKKECFRFAALQSASGQKLLKHHELSSTDLDTFVLIAEGCCYTKSTAALIVTKKLGQGWPLLYGFIIVPQFMRDFVYSLIAKHRYRIFGKKKQCMVPAPEVEHRFLQP